MIGAILLGLFCGIVARMLVPGDAFRNMTVPIRALSTPPQSKMSVSPMPRPTVKIR